MFIFPNGVLFYDMCFMAIQNGILLMMKSGVVFHIGLRGVFEDDEMKLYYVFPVELVSPNC